MKINLGYLLLNCGLGIISNLAIANTTLAEAYPPEYTGQYLQNCIATSMNEGLAEPEAKKLCDCTIVEFQQQYSLETFKQLSSKAETDETAANELIAVGEFCLESILYE